jgi:hypothetical protein
LNWAVAGFQAQRVGNLAQRVQLGVPRAIFDPADKLLVNPGEWPNLILWNLSLICDI